MGEARDRGTRDERVAEAIQAGRRKTNASGKANHHSLTMTALGMSLLAHARRKVSKAKRR